MTLAVVVHRMSSRYRNAAGLARGEWNGAGSCAKQRARVTSAEQRDGNGTLSAMLVRGPLSRFISGVQEEMVTNCVKWVRWREERSRTAKNLDGRAISCKRMRPTAEHPAQVMLTEPLGGVTAWDKPNNWPVLLRAYVRDMHAGLASQHTDQQAFYVHKFGATAPLDFLVRLERFEEDWNALISTLGLAGPLYSQLPQHRHSNARKKANESKTKSMTKSALPPFDASTWSIVCRHLAADFACFSGLGPAYLPPPPCITDGALR